jgi:hypothetical protein
MNLRSTIDGINVNMRNTDEGDHLISRGDHSKLGTIVYGGSYELRTAIEERSYSYELLVFS